LSHTNGPDSGTSVHNPQPVRETAQQTGEQMRRAGAEALDHGRDIAREATAHTKSIAGTVKENAVSAAESQKATLSDRLEDVAKAIHRSSGELEGHQDWLAHLVERGAAELNAVARTLRTNDLQALINDLGSLARRQPALFVGASMAAGVALTRIGRVAMTNPPQTGPSETAASTASADTSPEVAHERR
jgi:hypothetical protein